MQVADNEGVAIHVVPESCAVCREAQREALTGVSIGQALSRERTLIPSADAFYSAEGSMSQRAIASVGSTRRGRRPWHVDTRYAREPGGLQLGRMHCIAAVRVGKASSHTPTMYGPEKSDLFVVATKRTNKTQGAAGGVRGAKEEGRGEHLRAAHAPDTEPGKRVLVTRRVRASGARFRVTPKVGARCVNCARRDLSRILINSVQQSDPSRYTCLAQAGIAV